MQDMEQTIRERAYHMSNDAGRPDDRSESFWLIAQRAVLESSLQQIASVKPNRKTTKTKATAAPRKRKVV
ncbi:DUF2934 domain-containing protein [Tardiphaga sp.]|jgi:hypothetical protein|uniref:DUF2934 domain-containing protein n=1 Tax=Tardiphaga sp. TaxID=1926292 RepID=UPI0037DA7245